MAVTQFEDEFSGFIYTLKSTIQCYKQKYPKGTRIELIQMGNDPRPVPPGTRGTVAYVDDMGQIGMHWDNGQSLSLIPGEDSFRVLNQEEFANEQNAASFETVGPTLT